MAVPKQHTVATSDGGFVRVSVGGSYTRALAIRLHCTECLGWQTHPRDCTDTTCALFPFRGKSLRAMRGAAPEITEAK